MMNELDEATALIWKEADMLDAADLDNWMALYSEDGTYWMPASHDQPDAENHISHFYDDRVMMEIRRRNFVHPRAASKDHQVRCSHMISNFQLLEGKPQENTFSVSSNFQVLMYYREQQRIFGGKYRHDFVRMNSELKIRHKRVDLINCDAAHSSIIIYL